MTLTRGILSLRRTALSPNAASKRILFYVVMRHDAAAALLLRGSVACAARFPCTHHHISEGLLPFPGLSLAFSERCWPLSPQSAPSPNSTQPSCSASVFGCVEEGDKSNNDRADRYGDLRGEIINVPWRNNSDKCN